MPSVLQLTAYIIPLGMYAVCSELKIHNDNTNYNDTTKDIFKIYPDFNVFQS